MKNKRSNHEDEGEYVRERKRGVLKSGEKECPEGRRERESPEIKKRSANSSQIFAQNFPPFSRSLALSPWHIPCTQRVNFVPSRTLHQQ